MNDQAQQARSARDIASIVNNALSQTVLTVASDEPSVEHVPFGVLPFDMLLGGGLPRGRMTEIFGAPSSLKSYLGLCAAREVQASGGVAALVDTEHTFDPDWATAIGVDTEELLVQHPETGELAFDTMEALVRVPVDLLVVDSVAATLPQAEQTTRLHKQQAQPARLAALMSSGLRKVTTANRSTAILWLNQLREQVGVTFGPTDRAPGGRSLPFYASVRVNIKQAGKLTTNRKVHDGEGWVDGRIQTGQKWRATTEKNKLDRPHQEMYFTWDYANAQVDSTGFLVAQGIEYGYIEQKGSMWYLDLPNTSQSVRGREKLRKLLEDDTDARAELVERISGFPGGQVPRSSTAGSPSDSNFASEEHGSTRARGRGRSGSTGARRKK